MQENNKIFEKRDNGIYYIEYPETVTADLVIEETTAIIKDFIKTKGDSPKLMVLVDGSRVNVFEQAALNIAIGKMRTHLDARIAIIKMSENYKKAVIEFYKDTAPPPNVKHFDTAEEATKWLTDSSKDENRLIEISV